MSYCCRHSEHISQLKAELGSLHVSHAAELQKHHEESARAVTAAESRARREALLDKEVATAELKAQVGGLHVWRKGFVLVACLAVTALC